MSQYLDSLRIGDTIDFRGPSGLLVYEGKGGGTSETSSGVNAGHLSFREAFDSTCLSVFKSPSHHCLLDGDRVNTLFETERAIRGASELFGLEREPELFTVLYFWKC